MYAKKKQVKTQIRAVERRAFQVERDGRGSGGEGGEWAELNCVAL